MRALIRITASLGLTLLMVGGIAIMGAYLYLKPSLPDVQTLRTVQLQTPLQILTEDGLLIAQFGEKRRDPVRINEVPLDLVRAFLAAEDDNFRNHVGIDPAGLARAAWELVSTGQIQSGGSTITMQVAKNYFLSQERTFARKFREILLALEIERNLSKDEILELYFNVIFLGQRAYGVAAAAQIYYGQELDALTLPQYAMIAGLPKAPSKHNPIANPQRAIERRDWILGRMQKLGFIDEAQYKSALAATVTARVHGIPLDLNAPFVAEEARRIALDMFGDRAYTEGLRIYTTVRGAWQAAAQDAMTHGLLEYDQRHGWRGIEATLPGPDREAWLAALAEIESIGLLEPAVVSAVTDKRIDVIRRNGEAVSIPPSGFNWARTYRSVNSLGPEIRDARTLVSAGDLIRITQLRGDWVLAQQPAVEAGMVALDPETGAIRAMVGGFNYFDSKFNRATQGGRQVGSGFKPLIYTAALEAGMTPASLINDAPVVFDQTEGATDWRPQNSGGDFLGPTRLRTALYRSRNLVSVRLARELGLDRILQIAERAGLPSDSLPRNLSLSLGTASLTPLQMAETYAIYANGGYRIGNYLIDRIESATGEVLYQTKPVTVCRTDCAGRPVSMDPIVDNRLRPATSTLIDLDLGGSIAPRVLDARIHFLMDDMLRDVIQVGTGKRANSLGRKDIAGKTGTTNDQIDAWFNGYHASVVASVWVGFDQPKTLGRSEYGGRAALPIWIEFMETALAGQPERRLTPPPGIISARINADTGVLAGSNDGDAIREYFLADNPPPSQGADGGVPIISGQDGERTITSPQQLF